MPERNIQGAALIGRRIGIALFWFMAVFVIFASARSVISELYFGGDRDATPDEMHCAVALNELHNTLLERASQELRLPKDATRTSRWLQQWDQNYAATSGKCGSLSDTRQTLLALRERIEALLHDYAREQRPLSERIRRALQRFAPRSTHPTET
jgi:hypothetical protein